MSALVQATLWQARLQWRFGVMAAAIVVAAVWAVVLWLLPDAAMPRLLPGVLLGDTAIFGFYLLTGMLFLESEDEVLDALRISPLGPGRDLVARALPLTAVSVLIGVAITLVAHGREADWLALALGLGLAAPMHMLAGVAYGARFRTITDYIFPAALLLVIAGLPLFHFYGIWQPALMWAMPTMPPLTLLRGAFEPLSALEWAYGVAGSLAWTALAFVWARAEIHRFGRRRAGRPGRGGGGRMEAASTASGRPGLDAGGGDDAKASDDAGGRDDAMASDDAGRPGETEPAVDAGDPVGRPGARGLAAIALADLKNIGREPLMAFVAIYALVLALVVRWLLPVAEDLLTGVLDLTPYSPLIASSFALAVTPLLLGSVVGLLLLDEKDDGTLAALRVTPLPTARYAFYRVAFPVAISVIYTYFVVYIVDLVVPAPFELLPVAILSAAEAPIAMLFLAGLAGNKVEGLALSKLLGFFILAPVVAWFVAPPWRLLFGILPTYWPAEAFWRISGATGVDEIGRPIDASAWPILLVGAAYHLWLAWWLARRFVRR